MSAGVAVVVGGCGGLWGVVGGCGGLSIWVGYVVQVLCLLPTTC